MRKFLKQILVAVLIGLALYALNLAMSKEGLFGFGIDLYQVDLWKMAGINIILAVSLNLINGFTGQFSIGHAGFMAIGAYVSAYVTAAFGDRIRGAVGMLPPAFQNSVLLLIALGIAAGCAATTSRS